MCYWVLPAPGPPAGPPQRLHPHYGLNTPPNASTGLLGNECCLACTTIRAAAWYSHSEVCRNGIITSVKGCVLLRSKRSSKFSF
jgi:hypothetical protein